ncbi:hypothetical protein FKW77_001554 [Venturia effusa]|uniref:Heterokaryon incompatibility domain-containing protein n=1 Tax=Venturia effusa TaxID=50376 RepID=A0A517LI43_9PEZI|nr:hypothetical protein FKW77_001554 [Venturia effusa]
MAYAVEDLSYAFGVLIQKSLSTLDPEWIDLEILKRWLRTCDESHGIKCSHNPSRSETADHRLRASRMSLDSWHTRVWSRIAPPLHQPRNLRRYEDALPLESGQGRPLWLVSVDRGCLVKASAQHRYAALSYVWGQVPMLKTTRLNLDDLLREGALFQQNDPVPKTVSHTISLVRLLGIPYLWVDCLCIVQDDTDNLTHQLQSMASIYASAYVTIVAATGSNADHGLKGIRGVTDSRQFSPDRVYGIRDRIQPTTSIWYSRGWTFQEMVFSRRIIMLQYEIAIWACNSRSWDELTTDLKSPGFRLFQFGAKLQVLPCPDVEQYISLVMDYNTRRLTHTHDAYRAIAGLISALSKEFHGGFVSGLPQMFFESALLWQPSHPMERRSSSPSSGEKDYFPSWSWLGWYGNVGAEVFFGTLTLNSTTVPKEVLSPFSIVERQHRETYSLSNPDFPGIELIELSRERGNTMMDGASWQPRNKAGFFEFVNIMWIEWQDGIAYRKAIGQIMQHVWDGYELETIDVTLG